jgi:tRNA nucleotidyltransferase/poly(A) polymerase
VLGGVPRLVRFERLVAIEEANGLAPISALRLAALAVFVEEDAARLAEHLRLSNAEQAVLALAGFSIDAAVPDEGAAKALLYRLGPDAYRSRLLLAWADADIRPEDAAWRNALVLPQRWQAPVFPIGGNDVMGLGALKGPDIGELLKRLEREWIESGFTLDRDQLLAKAGAFIAARR